MVTSKTIDDIQKGSLEAFRIFFNQYYQSVKNFANGMLKNIDEADDVAQNVFMKIWLNRRSLSAERSLDSYVFTIARNEIYDSFRKTSAHTRYRLQATAPTRILDIESSFDTKEIRRILQETIEKMPEKRREIFKMSRQQYLSNEEIADRLHISKRTVEKHISLALKTIRAALDDFLFFIFIFFIS